MRLSAAERGDKIVSIKCVGGYSSIGGECVGKRVGERVGDRVGDRVRCRIGDRGALSVDVPCVTIAGVAHAGAGVLYMWRTHYYAQLHLFCLILIQASRAAAAMVKWDHAIRL